MTFGRIVLLWVLLAIVACSAPAADPVSAGADIKIATWNVFFRNTNLTEVVKVVREIRPDVLALQEITPRIEAELTAALSTELPYAQFRSEHGSGGCGVLSRWPLSGVLYLSPTGGVRGALMGTVTVPMGDSASNSVEFAVVHLTTPRVGRMKSLVSTLGVFQQSSEAQLEEMRRIHGAMRRTGPAVILGDFNSFSFSSAQTFLKEDHWQDSLLSVDPEADRRITWKGSEATGKLGGRIDYIFHTTQLRTIESAVIAKGSSDHFPVWARLRLFPATNTPASPRQAR